MKRKNKGLTKEQVLHVTGLANLTLTDEEIGVYTKQLSEILGYVEQLEEVDTLGVEPTYQTIDKAENVWREDEVRPSLTQVEALSTAKRKHKGYFVTRSVFDFNNARPSVAKAGPFQRSRKDSLNAILTEVSNEETPRLSEESPPRTIGHKDLFLTKGIETTAGARVLEGYKPQYSATVVERLEEVGYKTKYKFNCDAWAHGSSGENSDFGPTKNPWNEDFVPGGSSSGSAAAVAAGLVNFATGTDTGGSIRLPASFCGVTGLKPTYGAVSRFGIVAMASSLDSPGVIGRSAEEVKKLFKIMAKQDVKDATNLNQESPVRARTGDSWSDGQTIIGIPKEYFAEGVDGEVKRAAMEAVEELEKVGMKTKQVSLPNSKSAIAVYYLVQTTETASNLGRYDGIRYGRDRSFFGAEAKRRIMLGTFASSAGYAPKFFEKAARVRTLIIKDFDKAFEKVDMILAPVSPTPPFKLGEKANDPLKMYLSDILTVPVNLAGLPALALPCGFSQAGLPLGMQLIGPRWSEDLLFEVGKRYQELTEWHKMKSI